MFRLHLYIKHSHWLCALLLLGACSHDPKKVGPDSKPDPSEQFFVTEGQSSQATFSPDSDRLLFVSSGRSGHKQAQIYEKDLGTGTEKRITFQNGATTHPRYHPQHREIIYSSSTDELKESPPLLNPTPTVSKLPEPYQDGVEVYVHHLEGLTVNRITAHPGFDGEARYSNNGREVVWTQAHGERTRVLAANLGQGAVSLPPSRTVSDLGVNPTQYVIAPSSKVTAWVEWDQSFGVPRLMVRKGNSPPSEVGSGSIVPKTDVLFSSDSNWLMWSQKQPTNNVYELWIADVETLCARPYIVRGAAAERRYPSISPDLRWMAYTHVIKGRSRIARVAFQPPPPSATCGR